MNFTSDCLGLRNDSAVNVIKLSPYLNHTNQTLHNRQIDLQRHSMLFVNITIVLLYIMNPSSLQRGPSLDLPAPSCSPIPPILGYRDAVLTMSSI